jgi:hypothetical protein
VSAEKPTTEEARTVIGCAAVVLAALTVILVLTYLGLFPDYH